MITPLDFIFVKAARTNTSLHSSHSFVTDSLDLNLNLTYCRYCHGFMFRL